MSRPPPISTLFPYTTLFRSEDPYVVRGNTTPLVPGHAFSVEPGIYLPGRFGLRLEDIVVATGAGPDRKSTRLNSSHMSISYAVFCLKKKTSNIEHFGLNNTA